MDEFVDFFIDAGPPDAETLFAAVLRVGENAGPSMLYALEGEELLTPEAAAANIGRLWSITDYPDSHLDRESWRALFALAGYTEDGVPVARPGSALTLYRGSVPERRTDWSWTDRIEVAQQYASGVHARRPAGRVWQAEVEPWRLLARNVMERQESEYVVDTEGLLIVEAPLE